MLSSLLRALDTVVRSPGMLWNSDPEEYYRYLGDDVVEGQSTGFADPQKPLWLNLGYWKDARFYPDAAKALATKLAQAAHLQAGDKLLDVGFGFGEQDVYWSKAYELGRIEGINITRSQVERASARVAELGLSDRIVLQEGSAVELPFDADTFDNVTALESAHHFDTRQRFFEEAFRVLRPGGWLGTADGVAAPGQAVTWLQRMALRRWCVPLVNVYDSGEYCRRLAQVGFVDVQSESIRNYVFPGCTKYQRLRQQGVPMAEASVELTPQDIEQCTGLKLFEMTGLSDYVIVSARKPDAQSASEASPG